MKNYFQIGKRDDMPLNTITACAHACAYANVNHYPWLGGESMCPVSNSGQLYNFDHHHNCYPISDLSCILFYPKTWAYLRGVRFEGVQLLEHGCIFQPKRKCLDLGL